MMYSCVCDKCEDEFDIPAAGRKGGPDYLMYKLGNGVRFPLLKRRGWCKECNTVRPHEVIPDERAINATLESLDAQRRRFSSGEKFPLGKSWASLALESERNQGAWRDWASSRVAPRCITCGSKEIVPCSALDAPQIGVVLDILHPGCGGALTIQEKEDQIRLNHRALTEGSVHLVIEFSADGLATGDAFDMRCEWLGNSQEGIVDYLWDSLNLYKRTGDLLEISQSRYGDATRRRSLRGALERFISDVLAQRAISGLDPQSFPALFPDLHSRGAVIIRSFLDTLEITEPVPRSAVSPQEAPLMDPAVTPTSSSDSDVLVDARLPKSVVSHPFYVLGLTPRDTRIKIIETADEVSLHKDSQLCHKARSDLTSPRSRISAEVSWFPGLSPKRVNDCLRQLSVDISAATKFPTMSDLASANMLCAALDLTDEGCDPNLLVSLMSLLLDYSKAIKVQDVFNDINADRQVSGFTELKTHEQVEPELAERMRHYRQSITQALNRLESEQLLEVILRITQYSLELYEDDRPDLIHEVVDAYAAETLSILESGTQNIETLTEAVLAACTRPGPVLNAKLTALEGAVLSWSRVAKPIELSMESRGLEHEASAQLARKLRMLSVKIFHEHDLVEICQRLNNLIRKAFGEIAEIERITQQDDDALQTVVTQRQERKKEDEEWAQRIRFHAEVGLVFKDVLQLDADGVTWKGRKYALNDVTRVRWGAVRNSVNGIPTGTDYTIAFGDRTSESVVQTRREAVYSEFIGKFWSAVGPQIMVGMIESLKEGQSIRFGDTLVSDDGVVLTRRKFLGANQEIKCPWSKVRVWSDAGCFIIADKDDGKLFASLSYILVPNTHFLEHIIRANFKKAGLSLLSQTF